MTSTITPAKATRVSTAKRAPRPGTKAWANELKDNREALRVKFLDAVRNVSDAESNERATGDAYRLGIILAHADGADSLVPAQWRAALAEYKAGVECLPNASSKLVQWSWAAKIVKVHGVSKLSAMVARGESLQTFYNSMSKGKDVGPGSESNSDDKGGDTAKAGDKPKAGDKSAQEVLADILTMSERLSRLVDAGDIVSLAMLQQVGKTLGKVARVNQQSKADRAKRQADAAIKA